MKGRGTQFIADAARQDGLQRAPGARAAARARREESIARKRCLDVQGVKRAERLGCRPFILQRTKKIHHLPDSARQMLRRRGLHFARHAVKALVQQGRRDQPAQ